MLIKKKKKQQKLELTKFYATINRKRLFDTPHPSLMLDHFHINLNTEKKYNFRIKNLKQNGKSNRKRRKKKHK